MNNIFVDREELYAPFAYEPENVKCVGKFFYISVIEEIALRLKDGKPMCGEQFDYLLDSLERISKGENPDKAFRFSQTRGKLKSNALLFGEKMDLYECIKEIVEKNNCSESKAIDIFMQLNEEKKWGFPHLGKRSYQDICQEVREGFAQLNEMLLEYEKTGVMRKYKKKPNRAK